MYITYTIIDDQLNNDSPSYKISSDVFLFSDNTFATGSTFQVSYKQVSKSTNNNNTSPMATVVNGNGNNEDEMYIYEEKGLNPEFRKFLAGRKADD